MSRASFLSPIASPIAQTCREARRHRSQGMPSAGAAWAGPRRTENGPMQKPCAHPGTACVGTCPLPVAAQLLETASLRAACPGPCPDPTVHPGSGRGAHTRPHSLTLRRSMDTSPKAKWKWLLDYPPCGRIICTAASDHCCGGPGGAGTVLGVPG